MKAYYGAKISAHMTRTPEGFLVCQDVPICRTGVQQYLASEIGEAGCELVDVERKASDVFKASAIASFEGKPVTDDHPQCEVDSSNYAAYTKGAVQNVRQGTGRDSDKLICNLVIYDATLIAKVEAGKREISCGYDCKYIKRADGSYYQADIIGNHIAVVDNGRAGHEVAIRDAMPSVITNDKPKGGTHKMAKPNIFQRMFAAFAKDAEPDEVREAARAVDAAEAGLEEGGAAPEPVPTNDEDMQMVMQAIHELSEKVSALEAKNKENEPPTSLDTLEETLANGGGASADPAADEEPAATQPPEVLEEDEDETEEQGDQPIVEPEDDDEDGEGDSGDDGEEKAQARDRAVALSIVRAMKPHIAAMPSGQRRRASDALTKAVQNALQVNTKSQPLPGGYGALMKRKQTQDAAALAKRQADLRAFGDNCRKRNPHYANQKGDK